MQYHMMARVHRAERIFLMASLQNHPCLLQIRIRGIPHDNLDLGDLCRIIILLDALCYIFFVSFHIHDFVMTYSKHTALLRLNH